MHAADCKGVTPLMWAPCSEGSSSEYQKSMMQGAEGRETLAHVVQLLIQYGANIDAPDNDDITVLMFATFHAHTDVVRELLRAGADPTFRNKAGQTAYHLAISAMQMEAAEAVRRGPDLPALSFEQLRHAPVSGWLARVPQRPPVPPASRG